MTGVALPLKVTIRRKIRSPPPIRLIRYRLEFNYNLSAYNPYYIEACYTGYFYEVLDYYNEDRY